jgi:PIN domain nuclease of toxin-antitoxin system
MRLLLDTHIFLWLALGDKRLKGRALEAVRDPENQLYLSAVSVWEAAIKVRTGKLELDGEPYAYFRGRRRILNIESLTLLERSTRHLSTLPKLHKDPFDHMLICQALEHDLTLVTSDRLIFQYPVPLLRC